MRIKRLVLRNYRGVEESAIEFPSEGVTIVEGENEVGKTSFAEALHLVFDYLDSSKSTKIKEIQPVHRDAAPQVEEGLTTESAARAMRDSLAALAMIAEPGASPQIVRSGETSLEGLVRDMLRPMLAEWLDRNLPEMVERLVKAEIARIAGKKG